MNGPATAAERLPETVAWPPPSGAQKSTLLESLSNTEPMRGPLASSRVMVEETTNSTALTLVEILPPKSSPFMKKSSPWIGWPWIVRAGLDMEAFPPNRA